MSRTNLSVHTGKLVLPAGGTMVPQLDTRLVQTAVIGGRDSDRPIILPEEPHNLDEFRRQFGTDRFWCGTLLGGCGEKLMTKRYETKVCHFSHYPVHDGSRGLCHRTANGADSADHLFIKLHVKEWLAQQGHAAQAELRSFGGGPGDAVDFWLRATEQHLRFELRPEDYRSWRRAADSLGAKEGHVEWVFGPDGPITRDMVARQGYALRVRCETSANDRRVLIGTVTEKRPVAWAPLDACQMTRDGIVTPALEELRATGVVREGGMRSTPLPGSLPLRGAELVFAVDPGSEPPACSPLAAPDRYLVSGFIKPTGSRIVRACISLPNENPAPTDQFVYRLSGALQLLITDPIGVTGSSWAVRVDSLVRLNGLEAERTGLWRPSVSLADQVTAPPRPRTQPDTPPPPPTAPDRRSAVGDRVRRELEQVAAEHTTITWDGLARRTGVDLSHLPDPKRRDLLIEVDKPLRPDTPLLCVLVLAPSGRNLPYLTTILRMLGAQAPGSDAALRRWSQNEIERAHERYSPKPVFRPPSARQPAAASPATSKEASGAGWDVPPPGELRAASLMVKKLRLRLHDAADLLDRGMEDTAPDLTTAIEQAEKHLGDYETARRQSPTLRAWLKAGDPVVVALEHLISSTFADQQGAPTPAVTERQPADLPAKEESPVVGPAHAPTGAAPQAEDHDDTPEDAAYVEARAEFLAVVDLIRSAQADGNVTVVEAGRRMAGPLYARKLSPTDHERYTSLMREVKAWCLARKPKSQVDPPLARIRGLLAELSRNRQTQSLDDLRRALHEIGQLRRQLAEPLSNSDEGAVKRWRGRLTYRERTERNRSTQTTGAPADTTPTEKDVRADPSRAGHLPLETIDKLATAARQVLADQARAGGRLLTWGELRYRMGGALPHLHPDDQGELLVAVDQETPAGEPLLSTLIASADTSLHWLYRHVRFSLGRERIPDAELEAHWATEVLRLRQFWRHR
ncbi:hypothetical protein ABT040_39055 [Streptomyces sp. NPDC002688]|uniref:hypothetical protein n=1 Tax=Streptomyces sp. NPDC002688 TaxID=3154423 RepID=UPI003319201D